MKVLHQAAALSIVSLMYAAVPRFYHYYPVSGQNSLPMWLAIVVTFLNYNQNVLKRSRSLDSLWKM
jgi:amino acid permease